MEGKETSRLPFHDVPAMPAYVIRSGRIIAPFLDPVSETLLANATLAARQSAALSEARQQPIFVDALPDPLPTPCLVTFDYVYFSYLMLEQFLALAFRGKKDAVLASEETAVVRFAGALMDTPTEPDTSGGTRVLYDLFYLATPLTPLPKAPGELLEVLRRRAERVSVPKEEIAIPMRLARVQNASNRVEFPLTARVAGHVRHWVHILRLNQILISVELYDHIRRNRRMFRRRVVRTWLRALWNGEDSSKTSVFLRAFRASNVIGEGSYVHPTAEISSSFLGKNVVIGPGVRLRHCLIGDGTEVTEDCSLNYSVIGADCLVLRDTFMTGCVGYPESTLSNYKVQTSLFGRGVFLTTSAVLIDARFKGNVRVELDSELLDSGTPFLGSCLGHGVMLGAHVTVQSGRAVPNGYQIVADPDRVLNHIPAGLPAHETLVIRKGSLALLRQGA